MIILTSQHCLYRQYSLIEEVFINGELQQKTEKHTMYCHVAVL